MDSSFQTKNMLAKHFHFQKHFFIITDQVKAKYQVPLIF